MMELWKPLGARPRHGALDLWAQEQTQGCLCLPRRCREPRGHLPVLTGTAAVPKHTALPPAAAAAATRTVSHRAKDTKPDSGDFQDAQDRLCLHLHQPKTPVPAPSRACCPVPTLCWRFSRRSSAEPSFRAVLPQTQVGTPRESSDTPNHHAETGLVQGTSNGLVQPRSQQGCIPLEQLPEPPPA